MTLRVTITAGPTREFIDPVRFISNASSGKLGYLLAETALKDAAKVTLITGPVSITPPPKAKTIRVTSSDEMRAAALKQLPLTDIYVSSAAISDYKPASYSRQKIKRTRACLRLELEPTGDILCEVSREAAKAPGPKLIVGFALETSGALRNAAEKVKKKGLDLIVGNGPETIGSDTIKGFVLRGNGRVRHFPVMSKKKFARNLWALIRKEYERKKRAAFHNHPA